jgi:hypothetical protein
MAENTNISLTVDAWAKIVIERWVRKIVDLKIMGTGALVRSFAYTVTNDAGGNPEKIIFAFNYYGKFLEMGVGKGVALQEVEMSNRRKKPWQSKVFYGQVEALKRIMVEKYQLKSQIAITDAINSSKI